MKWFKLFNSWDEAEEIVPKGQLVKVIADEHQICLAHTSKGFRAIKDQCPHQGERLSKGVINGFHEVVCPWHSYRYNLDTGDESNVRTVNAKVFPIEERDGEIHLGIEK